MSNRLKAIGTELSDGRIPEQLNFIKEFGENLKNNPEEYNRLRSEIISAKNYEERLAILQDFSTTEESIRRLVPTRDGVNEVGDLVITIIITATYL